MLFGVLIDKIGVLVSQVLTLLMSSSPQDMKVVKMCYTADNVPIRTTLYHKHGSSAHGESRRIKVQLLLL